MSGDLNHLRVGEIAGSHRGRIIDRCGKRTILHRFAGYITARKRISFEPPQPVEQDHQLIPTRRVVQNVQLINHHGAYVLEHSRMMRQQRVE